MLIVVVPVLVEVVLGGLAAGLVLPVPPRAPALVRGPPPRALNLVPALGQAVELVPLCANWLGGQGLDVGIVFDVLVLVVAQVLLLIHLHFNYVINRPRGAGAVVQTPSS